MLRTKYGINNYFLSQYEKNQEMAKVYLKPFLPTDSSFYPFTNRYPHYLIIHFAIKYHQTLKEALETALAQHDYFECGEGWDEDDVKVELEWDGDDDLYLYLNVDILTHQEMLDCLTLMTTTLESLHVNS